MAKNREYRQKFATSIKADSLDSRISALSQLPVSQMRKVWNAQFANDPPPIRSRTILCQVFAWQMQSDVMCGLDSATERMLTKIGGALRRDGSYEPKIRGGLSAGVVLSREWKGVIHKVTISADGFDYLGKTYRSLSDIARTITGTRWSGPRFFGLEQKRHHPSRVIAS